MATNFTVSLEANKPDVKMEVLGYPHNLTSWGALIHMSSLQYEQSKDVLVRLSLPSSVNPAKLKLTATARFQRVSKKDTESVVGECAVDAYKGSVEYTIHRERLELVDNIARAAEKKDEPQAVLKLMRELVRSVEIDAHNPQVAAITQDVVGQVFEALSAKYYQKWGQHYLPSLAMAHLLQQVISYTSTFPLIIWKPLLFK